MSSTGATKKSRDIDRIILEDGSMRVALLNYGAITQGWWLDGVPLILGFDNPASYFEDSNFLGAIVGPVANRIGGASYCYDGVQVQLSANDGKNQLHGGSHGLWCKFWSIKQLTKNSARLTLLSAHGDNGFPGEVFFQLVIRLDYPRLCYSFTAITDRPTPISLAQHNYYTLGQKHDILSHSLRVASTSRLIKDTEGIPTGQIKSVVDDPLDLRRLKTLGELGKEIDDFFVFDAFRDKMVPVVEFISPTGIGMSVLSDQLGAQIYTGHNTSGQVVPWTGLCIEPSGYPNAMNIPSFPSMMHSSETSYQQQLILEISSNG